MKGGKGGGKTAKPASDPGTGVATPSSELGDIIRRFSAAPHAGPAAMASSQWWWTDWYCMDFDQQWYKAGPVSPPASEAQAPAAASADPSGSKHAARAGEHQAPRRDPPKKDPKTEPRALGSRPGRSREKMRRRNPRTARRRIPRTGL